MQVHNGCFFEAVERQTPDVLVSNPPYLPAPDDDILLPLLFGGVDGGAITRVTSDPLLVKLVALCICNCRAVERDSCTGPDFVGYHRDDAAHSVVLRP